MILAAAFAVGVAGVLFLTRRAGPPPVLPPVPAPSQAIPSPASPGDAPAVFPRPDAARGIARRTPGDGGFRTRSDPADGEGRILPCPLPRRRPAPRRASASSVPAADLPATAGAGPLPVTGERIDPGLEKFNAGIAALNRGDAEEAARLLREVTATSPGLVEGWNALGLALLRQKRLDEADAVFSKVLSLSPRYAPGAA